MQRISHTGARQRSLRHTLFICTLLAAGLASAPLLAKNKDQNDDQTSNGPRVTTTDGAVRGFTKDGVNVFLGIPYAAPPVGKLRWQPPQPVKRWKGELDATEYGNTCPQVTELGAFAGPASTTEDCLYLNVFTTGAGKNANKKKPVIVWIYGGANEDGESNDYDGSKLAMGGPEGQETVVVTLNYRVGIFGFFSNAAINKEGHLWGNYGIMDQQAVLRWVQRNISAFGGDPNKVTLGGQSAGAYDTSANLISPYSQSLFNRAILQSYPPTTWLTAETTLTRGTNFGVAAGCPGSNAKTADCLRDLSAARILQLQGTPNAGSAYLAQVFVDGTVIPLQPDDAWKSGKYQHMPIMTGDVHDEGNFGIATSEYFTMTPMTQDQYLARVTGDALAQYPLSNYANNPVLAYNAYGSDQQACSTLHAVQELAQTVSVYAYEFNYQDAPYHFPKMPGFKPMAVHTVDIQFLFPGYHGGQLGVNLDQTTGQPRELDAKETKLSDQLVAAWTNFAKSGNPNGSGNSPWPKFGKGNNAKFYSQNIPQSSIYSAEDYATNHKCDYWFNRLGY